MTDDDIRALRGALADGPMLGPWYVDHHYPDTIDGHVAISSKDHDAFAQVVWSMSDERALGMPSPRQEATTTYIAVASPDRIARLLDEVERLRKDSERLDWLGDPANVIGHVLLPSEIVARHLESLRDAIDAARKEGK